MLFFACENDSQSASSTTDLVQLQFICESISADDTAPTSALHIVIDEAQVKIAETHVCDLMDKSSWEQYRIPSEAMAAAGGWWAGLGHYFYAIQKGGEIQILQTFVEEMQEEESAYELVATYSKGKFSFVEN